METSILTMFSDFGVAGVLIFVVYFLLKYIKTKDDLIQELLGVNQQQNIAINDINSCIRDLSDSQKESVQFARYGYWWINTHQPQPDCCSTCPDYGTCFHPRKIILKNTPAVMKFPPEIPRK